MLEDYELQCYETLLLEKNDGDLLYAVFTVRNHVVLQGLSESFRYSKTTINVLGYDAE